MPPQFAKMVSQLPPLEISPNQTVTRTVSHVPRRTATFLATRFGSLLGHCGPNLSPESFTIALKFAFIPTRIAKASRISCAASRALIGPRRRRHYVIFMQISPHFEAFSQIRALKLQIQMPRCKVLKKLCMKRTFECLKSPILSQ